MLDREQVRNFLDGRVHEKGAAQQKDDRRDRELAFEHPRPVNREKRVREGLQQGHDHEEQYDPEDQRDHDPQTPNLCPRFGGRALGFDRDVEQVVEPKYCLQENQHSEVGGILHTEQIHDFSPGRD